MLWGVAGDARWSRLSLSQNSMSSIPLPCVLSLMLVLACTNRDLATSCGSDRKPCA